MREVPEFEQHLRELASEPNATPIHVGLFDEGERVSKRTIESFESDARFELTGDGDADTRYRCVETKGQVEIQAWRRRSYSVHAAEGDHTGLLLAETRAGTPHLPTPEGTVTGQLLQDAYQFDEFEPPLAARVAGLAEERTTIQEFLSQDVGRWGLREGTGMLLTGPPGTGKTELVKDICERWFGEVPVTISGPEVLNRWLGESEAKLRKRFQEARNAAVPVIYIDEIDAIGRERADADQAHTAQIVSQLLVLLDGIGTKETSQRLPGRTTPAREAAKSLQVIASTNRPNQLDTALLRPGRLGDEMLRFDLPDMETRRVIFHHYLSLMETNGAPLTQRLNRFVTTDLTALGTKLIKTTAGFTGADIEKAVMVAARQALKSQSEGEATELSQTYLRQGIETTKAQTGRRLQQTTLDRFSEFSSGR